MAEAVKPIFDPWSEAFKTDAFQVYKDFRAHAPVFQNVDGGWIIATYDACFRLLSDRKSLLRTPELGNFPPGRFHDYNRFSMAYMDAPDHPRVRSALASAFTAGALANLGPAIQAACDELLDKLIDADSFDFVKEFAEPFPLHVVCELIGVPRDERALFHRAAHAVTAGLEPGASAERLAAADRACTELGEVLEGYMEERRRTPTGDIISLMLTHQESSKLTHDEFVNQLIFLLLAGHETTATLLTFGMKLLLEQPDVANRLRDNPDLIGKAVEEFLRLHPAVHFVPYTAAQPIEIQGVTIPAGSHMTVMLASANRDADQFPNPDVLDIERSNSARHLAFSTGGHSCLGNNLARAEARIAFKTILSRMPDLQSGGTPKRVDKIMFQGFESLPVRRAMTTEPA
ncbi:Biotin biosynthesis cytochrome P450 (plasmid) [Sphingobium sp. AntQ-1]|uniref:cytochrome P450 n=1 Tax=Sphingobium sp. AntQ-1 TaxID=2930091 RepID=UPI00234F7C63|nr:cytochrome P450 [Sphingobium sp. AntQ-1]WCP15926.1 Biotin biosynthesis cytochrome P450 [Sphingobium sp. AntQ-1]